MKKIWITIGLTFILFFRVDAQGFDCGLAVGINMSSLHLTPAPLEIKELSPIITYNFNGYINYKSKGFWGVSIEPGIIKKGWSHFNDDGNVKNDMEIFYLQAPVLANIYFSKKLFLSVGPEFGYMLTAKNKYSNPNKGTIELTNRLNRFELSGIAGINYDITKNLNIGFRYSLGLTEISDSISWGLDSLLSELFSATKDYNQYFQLIFRVKIKTGGNNKV